MKAPSGWRNGSFGAPGALLFETFFQAGTLRPYGSFVTADYHQTNTITRYGAPNVDSKPCLIAG
ncbi:MAG: hypothetical protein ACE5Q3_02785 [Alphaproteobacteria bacterium]